MGSAESTESWVALDNCSKVHAAAALTNTQTVISVVRLNTGTLL